MSQPKKKAKIKLKFKLVTRGEYGKHPKEFEKCLVMKNKEDMRGLVLAKFAEGIDFEKCFLLYVGCGEQPSGGFKVKLARLFQKEKDLSAFVKIRLSKKFDIGTLAKTRPWALFCVDFPDYEALSLDKEIWKLKKEHKVYVMRKKEKRKKKKKLGETVQK